MLTNRKVPNVVLVTERFTALAKAVRIGKGIPDQPSLNIRGNPEFCEESELLAIVDGLLDDFVDLIAPGVRSVQAGMVKRRATS